MLNTLTTFRALLRSSYLPKEIRIQQQWCRDCYIGAEVIKSSMPHLQGPTNAGVYLPAIIAENEEQLWRDQYLEESWFLPAFEEFIDDCIGLMNLNDSNLKVEAAKEDLEWLTEFTTDDREGLAGLKKKINLEQWLTGQFVIAVDTLTNRKGEQYFKAVGYASEAIVLTTKMNDRPVVVLSEYVPEFNVDTKQNDLKIFYRVFGLDEIQGELRYYTATFNEEEWKAVNLTRIPNKKYPKYKGQYLDRLPLVCINTNSLGFDTFTKVPAASLAQAVVQVYRRDGRLTFGQRYAANPTPVFKNVDFSGDVKRDGRQGTDYAKGPGFDADCPVVQQSQSQGVVYIGGSKAIVIKSSSPQIPADVGYLEPVCAGFDSMLESIRDIREYIAGWDIRRLLSTSGTNASAEAVSMRGQVGIADIQIVDEISANGISALLRIAAIWAGVSEEDAQKKIEYTVNKDYVRTEYQAPNAPKDSQIRQLNGEQQGQEQPSNNQQENQNG